MTLLNLTQKEADILKYLEKTKKPVSKTQIGVKVGQKPTKSAARWANEALESLLEKKMIATTKVGFRTFYTIPKTPQALSTEEIKEEFEKEQAEPTLSKNETEKQVDFNFKKARKEISKIIEQSIMHKTQYESKRVLISKAITKWQNENEVIPPDYFQKVVRFLSKKYDPQPKSRVRKTTMLERLNTLEIMENAKLFYETHIKPHNFTYSSAKRRLNKYIRELITPHFSEKSMRANMVKSYITTTSHKIITGKDREMRDDGRPFVKGQRVKYKNKYGQIKTGVILRVYHDKVSFQRTVVVMPDDSTKQEMKVDRKIIAILS